MSDIFLVSVLGLAVFSLRLVVFISCVFLLELAQKNTARPRDTNLKYIYSHEVWVACCAAAGLPGLRCCPTARLHLPEFSARSCRSHDISTWWALRLRLLVQTSDGLYGVRFTAQHCFVFSSVFNLHVHVWLFVFNSLVPAYLFT